MSIYFAREDKNGWIKIGSSRNPEQRVKSIRSSTGPSIGNVELLKVVEDGSFDEEILYQDLLWKHHVRPDKNIASREWFEPSDDVMFFVNSLKEYLEKFHQDVRAAQWKYGHRVKFVFNGEKVVMKGRK